MERGYKNEKKKGWNGKKEIPKYSRERNDDKSQARLVWPLTFDFFFLSLLRDLREEKHYKLKSDAIIEFFWKKKKILKIVAGGLRNPSPGFYRYTSDVNKKLWLTHFKVKLKHLI